MSSRPACRPTSGASNTGMTARQGLMHKTEPKLAAIDERVIGRVRGAVGLDEGHRDSRNLI